MTVSLSSIPTKTVWASCIRFICRKYRYRIGVADTSLNITQKWIGKEIGDIEHHYQPNLATKWEGIACSSLPTEAPAIRTRE